MEKILRGSLRGLATCAAGAVFLAACGGGDAQQSGAMQARLLANGEACNPVWVGTTAYVGGNKVSYNGVNYTANWWTQGNNPSTSNGGAGTGQPWTAGFTCGGATTTTTKPVTTTTPAGTTTTTASSGAVCFYQDINFQGGSFCVNEGAADTPAGWNDAASSVKVASGYSVSLYADAGQQGASVVLGADEPSLVNRSFNDLLSSFKVVKAGTTTTKATTTTTASSCSFIMWATGQNYAVGTVVKYAANGNFYKLVNAGANGSDGTDPTVSTWYWSQTTCGAGATTTVASTTTTTKAGELRVLTYLKNLSGHGIIGGLIRDHKDGAVEREVMADAGVPLGFYGADFGFGDAASTANRAALMQKLIAQYRQGVVVHLMWHACSPLKAVTNQQETGCYWGDKDHPDGGIMPSGMRQDQWDDLVRDGGNLNKIWKGRLDLIAPHFQTLKDAGVQVLFRPFHEVNQGAFWWGGRIGSQGTARLFELTREYLEQKYNLHNIIWVWDVQDLTAPSTYASYLPRDAYWDIAALDMYSEGHTKAHYDAMLALAKGKPIAIGESFNIPSPATLAAQPKWVFFMGWSDPEFLQYNSYDQIRTFYRSAVPPKPGF